LVPSFKGVQAFAFGDVGDSVGFPFASPVLSFFKMGTEFTCCAKQPPPVSRGRPGLGQTVLSSPCKLCRGSRGRWCNLVVLAWGASIARPSVYRRPGFAPPNRKRYVPTPTFRGGVFPQAGCLPWRLAAALGTTRSFFPRSKRMAADPEDLARARRFVKLIRVWVLLSPLGFLDGALGELSFVFLFIFPCFSSGRHPSRQTPPTRVPALRQKPQPPPWRFCIFEFPPFALPPLH